MPNDYRIGPASGGTARYHILFLHGYGSGGRLMADYVGRGLGRLLPEARMYFPDAPLYEGTDEAGNTYNHWFHVEKEMLEEKAPIDPLLMARRALDSVSEVNTYIDRLLKEEGIGEDQLIVAGFSQGATMAYYASLLRERPVAGVFCISGGALDRLHDPLSRPPVVLCAGEFESGDYCGVSQIVKNSAVLGAAGFKADYYILPGQGHAIGDWGLACLAEFACGNLPVKPFYISQPPSGPFPAAPQP